MTLLAIKSIATVLVIWKSNKDGFWTPGFVVKFSESAPLLLSTWKDCSNRRSAQRAFTEALFSCTTTLKISTMSCCFWSMLMAAPCSTFWGLGEEPRIGMMRLQQRPLGRSITYHIIYICLFYLVCLVLFLLALPRGLQKKISLINTVFS